jgi:hypothetical protein
MTKKHHKQNYQGWQLKTSKDKTKTRVIWRGSLPYWIACVRRINIFADTELKAGNLIQTDVNQYIIDGKSRLKLALTFRKLNKPYEDKVGEHRLFNKEQESEIKRILNGGSLVLRPE